MKKIYSESQVPLLIQSIDGVVPSGFKRLITNPDQTSVFECIRDKTHPFVLVRNYLHYILTGNESNAFCPFVSLIERKNGYYVKEYPQAEEREVVFQRAIDELLDAFVLFSPYAERFQTHTDPTTVIAVFTDPSLRTEEGLKRLQEFQLRARAEFLTQGLMLANAHPLHPLGRGTGTGPFSSKPIFACMVPILILRRMHPGDAVFMRNDEEKRIHASFFGDTIHGCPHHSGGAA